MYAAILLIDFYIMKTQKLITELNGFSKIFNIQFQFSMNYARVERLELPANGFGDRYSTNWATPVYKYLISGLLTLVYREQLKPLSRTHVPQPKRTAKVKQ